MMFFDQLTRRIFATKTRLCLGIDPQVPAGCQLLGAETSETDVVEQTVSVLVSQAIKHELPAVKFQSAYFEAMGNPGLQILQYAILQLKKKGVLAILDAKRGDISSTMTAYGRSAFEIMQADCLTVNPYMGIDTIEPLLPWLKTGKGAYVVWLTSNRSADAIQMPICDDASPHAALVYNIFKQFSQDNAINQSVGYVLGATKLSGGPVLKMLESIENERFLLPGVGAQGAVVDAVLKKFLSRHPSSLVPVSRDIGGLKADVNSLAEYTDKVSRSIDRLKKELSF